jgi:hypothetical protein
LRVCMRVPAWSLTWMGLPGAVFLYCRGRADPPHGPTPGGLPTAAERQAAFSRVAATYDREIGLDETVRSRPALRRIAEV